MRSSLHVTATLEVLAEVRAFVRSTTRGLGADRRTVGALVQAVDEWVTNVVVHGYGGAPGPVDVEISGDGADVVVVVRDTAPVFDPASAPAFDRDLPLAQRPFGGMGIALIRDLCSTFEHQALPPVGNEVTFRRPASSAEHEPDHQLGPQGGNE
jgi:anti-sigma regulatory factor (Ser/Thr protein kinase)